MSTPFIALKRLPYDDLEWHVEINASNGYFSGVQDFYTYPQDLTIFSLNLVRFPQNNRDEVRFELGCTDNKYAYFVLLRAFMYNSVGHTAIEFVVDNNKKIPNRAQTSFFILTEVNEINNFGQQIKSWLISNHTPLVWTPYVIKSNY